MANYIDAIKAAGGETYQIRDSEAARKNETETALKDKVDTKELFNLIYPVGAIYLSAVNFNPGTVFGGTWEQIKDRFLLSAGDSYEVGTTGGKTNYELSANIGAVDGTTTALGYTTNGPTAYQLAHGPSYVVYGASSTGFPDSVWNHSTNVTEHGVNESYITIMPPYLTVYMWKRVE